MYVAVKGGEAAILNSYQLLARQRRGDAARPELSVAQIRQQLKLAVDRVMTEGSVYDPELAALAQGMTDEQIDRLKRGGHDLVKIHAAYAAASTHKGQPTVILAHTKKGYGMGTAGQGKMTTHSQKKLDDTDLIEFRNRFNLPLTDEQATSLAFYKPAEDSAEMQYLRRHRQQLGGYLPPEQMLKVLDGNRMALRFWLKYGGEETLLSWGLEPDMIERATLSEGGQWQLIEAFRAQVSPALAQWMRRLPSRMCWRAASKAVAW